MLNRLLISALAAMFAVPLAAGPADLPSVAMLVLEGSPSVIDAAVAEALTAKDPAVRATAARVAAVRNRTPLVPAIEASLASEQVAEVARELVRASIVLGGTERIDAAIAVSERFDHRLDTAIAIAAARLGSEAALTAYAGPLKRLTSYPKPAFFRVAFWGSVNLVPKTARALLAANDERGWSALVEAMGESDFVLDSRSIEAALSHPSTEIRRTTLAGLVQEYSPRYPFADPVKRVLRESVAPDAEPVEIAFDREILRRVAGAEPRTTPEFLAWLAFEPVATALSRRPFLLELLTKEERAALPRDRKKPARRMPAAPMTDVVPPPFYTPDVLPEGAADAILTATGCRSGWLGLGEVKVDRAGRVVSLDVSGVNTDASCRRAVAAMTSLALVHPMSIGSPFETKHAIFVRSPKAPLCLDEAPVPPAGQENIEACSLFVIGEASSCKPPVVVQRTELRKLPATNSAVVLEALVSETGCVRSARIVSQSAPQLNGPALLSLVEWKFKPATRAGVPIPTLFNLTISVRR